jgi:hypothetical protein
MWDWAEAFIAAAGITCFVIACSYIILWAFP